MKKQNYGHRWTDEEFKKLIGGWLEGKSLDELGREFSCTRHGIHKAITRLRKDGIPLPRRKHGHAAGRKNCPWTQQEVEYLVRRREDQVSADQIALELDRSFLAVQNMIALLRKEGVEVKMLGMGVRRLWNPEILKAALVGRGLKKEENLAQA